MSAVTFDTLKFVEKLEAGGFSLEQAKAAAQAFADATPEQLATKAGLREEIAPIRADLLLVKGMMGLVLALQIAIFTKMFMR